VRLRVELEPVLPALAADPDQLQQLLLNLAMNGLDACSEGGSVLISAAPDPERETFVRIGVLDTGCGIPAEHRADVFDPFFTTKKRGQGTGLGLTVAARIARNHGAQIDIDSEEGFGTQVTVRWPTTAPEQGRA
jgi:signal transduction histidine kinase